MLHSRSDGTIYPAEDCRIYADLRDEKTYSSEEEVFWRNVGRCFPAGDISTPIIEHGAATGAIVIFKDITERRVTETSLRDSEERFRQVTEHVGDVFWMTDLEKSRMLYVSPGYYQVWGRSC